MNKTDVSESRTADRIHSSSHDRASEVQVILSEAPEVRSPPPSQWQIQEDASAVSPAVVLESHSESSSEDRDEDFSLPEHRRI